MGIKNDFDLNNSKKETDRINLNKKKIYKIYHRKKTNKFKKYISVFDTPENLTDRDKLEIVFLVMGIFMIGFISPLVYYTLEAGYIRVLILGIIDLLFSQVIQKKVFEDNTRIEAEF
jgi:hypothetical protein